MLITEFNQIKQNTYNDGLGDFQFTTDGSSHGNPFTQPEVQEVHLEGG